MVMSTLEELYIQGKIEGKREGKREGKIEGIIEGKREGKREGEKEGEENGKIKARAQDVLKILNKRFKHIPEPIVQSVSSYTDLVALDSLFEGALDCETLAEFERELAH